MTSEASAEPSPISAPSGAAGPPRLSPLSIALLLLILALAAVVRFGVGDFWIGVKGFTLDEIWHAELSTGRGSVHNHLPHDQLLESPPPKLSGLSDAPPWYSVWTHMNDTVHPPLYPQLLRLWRGAIGEGEAASRAFGVVTSVLSVMLIFGVVCDHHASTRAALWASLLFALAGPQVQLARELRGYALLTMALLGMAWAVVRIERFGLNGKRGFAIFGCTLAALLTHYFSVFVVGAIGLYVLIRFRGRARVITAGLMLAAGFAFLGAWLPWMLPQRDTLPANTDAWIYDGWEGHIARTLQNLGALPLRMLFEPRQATIQIAVMGAVLYLLPILFVRKRPELLFWLLWLVSLALGLFAMDMARDTKHLFHIRYTMFAGPAVFALMATLLDHFEGWKKHVLPAVAALGCVVYIGAAFEEPQPSYREMAAFVDQNIKPGEVVAVYSRPNSWIGSAQYLCISHESRTYPWPVVMLSGEASGALAEQLRARPGVWVMLGERPQGPLLPGDFRPTGVGREVPFVGYTERFVHVPTTNPSSRPGTAAP